MTEAEDRQQAAKRYLEQTLAENDPAEMIETLQAAIPAGAGIGEMIVHASDELTMLFARVPPRFQSGIHNHTVFACIGQLEGEEVSTVFEPAENGDGLTAVHTQSSRAGEVVDLPADVIHSIENPGDGYGMSLHVYGGDFGALMERRSLWSANGHDEQAFSFEALVGESVKTMKQSRNERGLEALAEAIPAAKPMIDSLQASPED
jgi:predicted metal-dependent enzyme (double-stranded beta helix superfamily)